MKMHRISNETDPMQRKKSNRKKDGSFDGPGMDNDKRQDYKISPENSIKTREEAVFLREVIVDAREKKIQEVEAAQTEIENHIIRLREANENLVLATVTAQAMTEEAKKANDQMGHMAHHDSLTSLPNRVLLKDRIAQAIVQAKRRGTSLAVLFLDLDNFKNINDSLGHTIGDKLLQAVARNLQDCVRSTDTVSRQGGDEFVILVTEDKYVEDAVLTADKILTSLSAPQSIDGHNLHVTTSIGISVYPADGSDADTLIKNADTAMYQAKEKGRNSYQFFTNDMNVRVVERQVIESGLRNALQRQEFMLHYQPKVNLESGRITGAEALLRWAHPQWGLVMPSRFVSIAEDSGLILPIGHWVLRQACAQASLWLEAGLKPISVAVNISALEFRQKDFIEGLRAILQETGLNPCYLQLEITESVLMRNAKSSTEILKKLKDMGVQLAVDDFGTGYSSLSYLHKFPIDVIKIDKSFVHDLGSNKDNGIIVNAVIAMGASLHQRVVAEGVETDAHLAFLKAGHCDEGQGYLFSRPLDAEKFSTLLSTGLP